MVEVSVYLKKCLGCNVREGIKYIVEMSSLIGKTIVNCLVCNESFTASSSLRRHQKQGRCKAMQLWNSDASVKNLVATMNHNTQEVSHELVELHKQLGIYQEIQKHMEAKQHTMEQEIKRLTGVVMELLTSTMAHTKHQTNCLNIASGSNNNNITIVINSYGCEDISHISHNDKVKWAADPKSGVVEYVQKKHFHPDRPQNHNLKMASIKREELSVRMDGSWKRVPAKPFLNKVLVTTVDELSNCIDWSTIHPEAEKYYADVDENSQCKEGKDTVDKLFCMIDNQREITSAHKDAPCQSLLHPEAA